MQTKLTVAQTIAKLSEYGWTDIQHKSRSASISAIYPEWMEYGYRVGTFDARDVLEWTVEEWKKRQSNQPENQPEENNFSFQPTNQPATQTGQTAMYHKATVRILNSNNGKYEIVESQSDRVSVGTIGNSTLTNNKPVGSLWDVEIDIPGKSSLKIRSIAAHVSPTAIPAANPIVPAVNTPTVAQPTVAQPNAPLTANIAGWDSPDYYISPNAREVFTYAYKMLQRNGSKAVRILLTGETGNGKTTIAFKFGEYVNFKVLHINCATMRDTTEWFGHMTVKEENGASVMEFKPSEFVSTLSDGNCIILLDELNRVPADMHNSLFPLLDDTGKTSVYGLPITVGPNVMFCATVNRGINYNATFELDLAFQNRFDFVLEMGNMPSDKEIALLEKIHGLSTQDATQIVGTATMIRHNSDLGVVCSTRDTLRIARMVSVGMSIRDAYEFALILRIPNDETNAPLRKSLVDLVNIELGARAVEFSSLS